MSPEHDGEDVWFSVAEAAEVLQVGRQAVYAAIKAKRLPAHVEPYRTRIHIRDLIAYGVKVGRSPEELVKRVQKKGEVDWGQLLFIVLGVFGLAWLITKVVQPRDEEK